MERVASAGFMVIALDMRGYGGSSAPVEAEAHTPYQTVGDLVAILDVASVATASVVGHDFGANIAWSSVAFRLRLRNTGCGLDEPLCSGTGAAREIQLGLKLLF
jgi:pimeloyl-ACP methyl ester carboxylesterase